MDILPWRVVTLKQGKLQRATFARPGGQTLADWIDNCPNAQFAALTFLGGAAWRVRLLDDIGMRPNVAELVASFDDEALAALMTNLGGFVNQRGLFRRQELADVFQQAKIPSAQKWSAH